VVCMAEGGHAGRPAGCTKYCGLLRSDDVCVHMCTPTTCTDAVHTGVPVWPLPRCLLQLVFRAGPKVQGRGSEVGGGRQHGASCARA
jgi:hypothetical protein